MMNLQVTDTTAVIAREQSIVETLRKAQRGEALPVAAGLEPVQARPGGLWQRVKLLTGA